MRILSYLIDHYSPLLCKIVELKRLTLRAAISIEMYRRGRPRGLELWDSRGGGGGVRKKCFSPPPKPFEIKRYRQMFKIDLKIILYQMIIPIIHARSSFSIDFYKRPSRLTVQAKSFFRIGLRAEERMWNEIHIILKNMFRKTRLRDRLSKLQSHLSFRRSLSRFSWNYEKNKNKKNKICSESLKLPLASPNCRCN